jgi:hypothetical protein
MWLRDFLPQDLTSEATNKPMARIMIYGYESGVANSNNMQNLEDLVTTLNTSLHAMAAGSIPKPIIFIGHSLGGLIIKQVGNVRNMFKRPSFNILCVIAFGNSIAIGKFTKQRTSPSRIRRHLLWYSTPWHEYKCTYFYGW